MSLREDFLHGMSRSAATVSVVTTDGPGGRAGVTVSAVTSVSADGPAPTMLACVNASSSAAGPILENGCFAINVLHEDQQDLADVFASRVDAPGGDKFNASAYAPLETGAPLLESALVSFDCTVSSAERVSTHWVLIGAVQAVRMRDDGAPLIYGMRRYLRAERT